jgi:hypothetical protein
MRLSTNSGSEVDQKWTHHRAVVMIGVLEAYKGSDGWPVRVLGQMIQGVGSRLLPEML